MAEHDDERAQDPAAPGEDGSRPPAEARRRWIPRVGPGDPRRPDVSDAAARVWDGLVWGRLGRNALAWRCWDGVADPSLLPWVAAERGRVLRELGLHDDARVIEEHALAEAMDLTDVVMLRISLAADALGVAAVDRERALASAARQLDAAQAMLDELPVDEPRTARQRLRARWVRTEIALARQERIRGDGLPRLGDDGPEYPDDHAARTDFHRAKGLMFAGVVRSDRSLLEHAAALAPPALRWAVELARLDAGDARAADRAVVAWEKVRPPPEHARAVAATPTARRLAALP